MFDVGVIRSEGKIHQNFRFPISAGYMSQPFELFRQNMGNNVDLITISSLIPQVRTVTDEFYIVTQNRDAPGIDPSSIYVFVSGHLKTADV